MTIFFKNAVTSCLRSSFSVLRGELTGHWRLRISPKMSDTDEASDPDLRSLRCPSGVCSILVNFSISISDWRRSYLNLMPCVFILLLSSKLWLCTIPLWWLSNRRVTNDNGKLSTGSTKSTDAWRWKDRVYFFLPFPDWLFQLWEKLPLYTSD